MSSGFIDADDLDALLGQGIDHICTVGFTSADTNHCAHFVSHVLGYQFGRTCRHMANGSGTAASIRVHELFPECPTVGRWQSRSSMLSQGLVFITNPANVDLAAKRMENVPKKHVGIFIGDVVWHYSNTQDRVIKQTATEFSRHYAPPDDGMFYGSLPGD
jgi:hypothetical protein